MSELIYLAIAFFRVGLLSIGGGYTLIPIIQNEVVNKYNWLGNEEFLQILGVTQGIPGAISIKLATYTGYKVAGFLGVLVAVISSMIVPVLLILLLYGVLVKIDTIPYSREFLKGVQFATAGLLISFAYKTFSGASFNLRGLALAMLAFLIMTFTKVDVAAVIIGIGIVGIFIF